MRGIYNGEIKDRPHIFNFIFYLFFLCFPLVFFYSGIKQVTHAPSTRWYHNDGQDHTLQGLVILFLGLLFFWFLIIAVGKEFIFLTINKSKIIIRRPMLVFSPFPKDKIIIEIPVADVAEINTYIPMRRRASRHWRIISHDGKELTKFVFSPEYIFSTVEPEDFFKAQGINIRVNRVNPDQ